MTVLKDFGLGQLQIVAGAGVQFGPRVLRVEDSPVKCVAGAGDCLLSHTLVDRAQLKCDFSGAIFRRNLTHFMNCRIPLIKRHPQEPLAQFRFDFLATCG